MVEKSSKFSFSFFSFLLSFHNWDVRSAVVVESSSDDSTNSEFSSEAVSIYFHPILDSSIFGNSNSLKTDPRIRLRSRVRLIIKRARGGKYPSRSSARDRYSWRDGISPLKPKIWWMAAKRSEVEPCPFGVFSAGRVTQSISRCLSRFPFFTRRAISQVTWPIDPFFEEREFKVFLSCDEQVGGKGTSGYLLREEATSVTQLLWEGKKKKRKNSLNLILESIFKWSSSGWSSMLIFDCK